MNVTPEMFLSATTLIGVARLIYLTGRFQEKTELGQKQLREDLSDHTTREEKALDAHRLRFENHSERLIRLEDRLAGTHRP